MKKWPFIMIPFLICSCGTNQVPEWKDASARQLENYKYSFLTDKESSTEPHFLKAKKAIARSNDLDLLGTAYLTNFAMHVSILEDFDDTDFLQINKLQPNAKNFAYYNFIKGNFQAADFSLLPSHYGKLLKPAQDKDLAAALKEISLMDDPVSRLVACGVWIKHLPFDDNFLMIAINTSAENGWSRPLFAYLNKLKQYYLDHNETAKAASIKERLELLKK
jgi:hypothetical protein